MRYRGCLRRSTLCPVASSHDCSACARQGELGVGRIEAVHCINRLSAYSLGNDVCAIAPSTTACAWLALEACGKLLIVAF